MDWVTFWAIFSQTYLITLELPRKHNIATNGTRSRVTRIFVYWAIVYLGQFFNYKNYLPQNWALHATFSMVKTMY
jgi:hypothetical protein